MPDGADFSCFLFIAACTMHEAGADLERSNVNDLLSWVVVEDAQHGQLSADGLAGACRRSQQHILICVVQCMEGLQQPACQTGRQTNEQNRTNYYNRK